MSKSWYGRGMWTTLFCFVSVTLASSVRPVAAQTTIAQQIADPAYFSPGAYWIQLDNSVPYVGIAVANVVNGPGNQADPNVRSAIQAAHNAGIKVLGYVNTGHFGLTGEFTRVGPSDKVSWQSQIESDVNAWYSLYGSHGIDGIFFDELENDCGPNNAYANLYTELQNYVKQKRLGAWVAANPGSPVPQCYQNAADILLTFENTYACYSNDSSCPQNQWYADLDWDPVDPQKIWHLVFNTSESQLPNASSLSKQRNAGYFYVTSGGLPNPWNFLPTGSYWTSEEIDSPSGGTPDDTKPTPPDTLDTVDVGATWATLSWGASTDPGGSGVVGYDIYESGVKIVSVAAASNPQATITGLAPSTCYTFTARARNAAGTVSRFSNVIQFTTDVADGSITAPGNLSSTQIGYTSATLSWTPSTDCCDYPVAYYDVYKGGTKILTLDATVTSVTVVGLTPGSSYTFTVQARDTQGDVSSSSNSFTLTTNSLPGGLAITNLGGSFTSTTLTYTAKYLLPFELRHVFIDSDNNSSTGLRITWTSPGVGIDYMIEKNTLYRYAGDGSSWAWTTVDTNIKPMLSGYTVTWQVPVSDFTNPATTQKALFQGEGLYSTSYGSTCAPKAQTCPLTRVQH